MKKILFLFLLLINLLPAVRNEGCTLESVSKVLGQDYGSEDGPANTTIDPTYDWGAGCSQDIVITTSGTSYLAGSTVSIDVEDASTGAPDIPDLQSALSSNSNASNASQVTITPYYTASSGGLGGLTAAGYAWQLLTGSGSVLGSGTYTYTSNGGSISTTTTGSTTTTTTSPISNRAHIVDPSQITAAAISTVSQMINLYGTQKAVCNISVDNVFKTLFNSSELDNMTANQMVQHWQSSSNWQPISTSQAQSYANLGRFVAAGWIDPTGVHGHVVVIVPGTGNIPNDMDCGGDKRTASQTINWSFGKRKINSVVYYMYK